MNKTWMPHMLSMSLYNKAMDGTKKVIILSKSTAEAEELSNQFSANTKLEIKVVCSEEEVLACLQQSREEVSALILILNELEMHTINNFGRHLHLSAKNPDFNFIAVLKNIRQLDFAVYFFSFPLITLGYGEVHTLPDRLSCLKQVA